MESKLFISVEWQKDLEEEPLYKGIKAENHFHLHGDMIQAMNLTFEEVEGPSRKKASLGLLLTDDEGIRHYNKIYRHKDQPTNVLAFPSSWDQEGLDQQGFDEKRDATDLYHDRGDLIVSLPYVLKEAIDQGKSFEQHLAHMLIHGVLHLLGYDHIDPQEAEVMEQKECNILEKMGWPNPYEVQVSMDKVILAPLEKPLSSSLFSSEVHP